MILKKPFGFERPEISDHSINSYKNLMPTKTEILGNRQKNYMKQFFLLNIVSFQRHLEKMLFLPRMNVVICFTKVRIVDPTLVCWKRFMRQFLGYCNTKEKKKLWNVICFQFRFEKYPSLFENKRQRTPTD